MRIPKFFSAVIVLIAVVVLVPACSEMQDQNVTLDSASMQSEDVAETAFEIVPLMAGMNAPEFSLTAADGTTYQFNPENLEKPLVLTFYRGGFCPYCNRQLAEFRHAETRLTEMGYSVAFASMDRAAILKSNLKIEDVNYTLLSDSKATLAKAFGLAYRVSDETIERYLKGGIDLEGDSGESHHILPVPATYIIGVDGVIDFAYVNPNYSERVHPDLVVKAAELALE